MGYVGKMREFFWINSLLDMLMIVSPPFQIIASKNFFTSSIQ